MDRRQFEAERERSWVEAENLIDALDKIKHHNPEHSGRLPEIFRRLCNDLALAEQRMYGAKLCDRLNRLIIRAHQHLYRRNSRGFEAFIRAIFTTFPQAVRAEWRLLVICTSLFVIPVIAISLMVQFDLRWADAILGPQGMEEIQLMYGKNASAISDTRGELGSDFLMFCFYIMNNVSIDFKIFAGGLLACLGTAFFLLYNGIYYGGVIGYIHHSCDPERFYLFTSGHASVELVAMVISGMAGGRLGLGIIAPGRLRRRDALRVAAKRALPLIIGAAVMTFIAAGIEGFWSGHDFPPSVKYPVGIGLWILVIGYLVFSGRSFSLRNTTP